MPAHKKPTVILEATGAFKKNPNRARPNEPISDVKFPVTAPLHFDELQTATWHEVVKIVPAGVLTGADVLTIEIIARLLTEYRTSGDEFPMARLGRLTSEMNKVGMSPSSRAGLTVDKPKKNKFDE